jgi:hypothetical protein
MSTNSVPLDSHGNEKRAHFAKLYAGIIAVVSDPGMLDSTPRRLAKAVVDGHIDEEELLALLADFRQKVIDGDVLYPGRYFVTCAKHLFAKHGLDWRKPWR